MKEVVEGIKEFCKTELGEWESEQEKILKEIEILIGKERTPNSPYYSRLEGRADFATEVLKEIEILKQEKINE